MKKQFLYFGILVFSLLLNIKIIAQNLNHKHSSVYIGLAFAPIINEYQPGLAIEIKYKINSKLSTGLLFIANSSSQNDTFGYKVKQPVINVIEVGWLNSFTIIEKKNLILNASLGNDLTVIRLGDNAEKTTTFTSKALATTSKEIVSNYYYTISPGLDASVRLYKTLFTSINIKYREMLGSPSFTSTSGFNGMNYSIGLTFILE
jgi:hypothetical protein